jgi:hypothetical protein
LGTAIRNDPQAIGYEMKANEEVGINPIIDVDKMDWSRVEAISKTLNPPEPEPPHPEPIPPEPIPPIPPKPPKEKSCWKKFMADRPIRKIKLGAFIKCLFKRLI